METEHPRARGENAASWASGGRISGTSPRTRGKLMRHTPHLATRRNIPAHAGKTCPASRTAGWNLEHPRARGENMARLCGVW